MRPSSCIAPLPPRATRRLGRRSSGSASPPELDRRSCVAKVALTWMGEDGMRTLRILAALGALATLSAAPAPAQPSAAPVAHAPAYRNFRAAIYVTVADTKR